MNINNKLFVILRKHTTAFVFHTEKTFQRHKTSVHTIIFLNIHVIF